MDEVDVELTSDEREMLSWGLLDWAGPASATDDLARVMGFESRADLSAQAPHIAEAVRTSQGLSRRDWTRALVATEFVWASDVFGSGVDSVATWGRTDAEGITILRSLQRKLLGANALISGRALA